MSKPSKNVPKTASRRNEGQFKLGNKGGPGRPQGSRNAASILLEKLMVADGEGVVKAMIAEAKEGNVAAGRLVLDRIAPAPRSRCVEIDLPTVSSAGDVLEALGEVVSAMVGGNLTPDEAGTIATMLKTHLHAVEVIELERRIAALEESETEK